MRITTLIPRQEKAISSTFSLCELYLGRRLGIGVVTDRQLMTILEGRSAKGVLRGYPFLKENVASRPDVQRKQRDPGVYTGTSVGGLYDTVGKFD